MAAAPGALDENGDERGDSTSRRVSVISNTGEASPEVDGDAVVDDVGTGIARVFRSADIVVVEAAPETGTTVTLGRTVRVCVALDDAERLMTVDGAAVLAAGDGRGCSSLELPRSMTQLAIAATVG